MICNHCILPHTFPGVTFDAAGVCSHCRHESTGAADRVPDTGQYERRFRGMLDRSGESYYDVLLAYSGGKDSTYTLSLLKRKYRLRVLAVSFDNGFFSETARSNILTVTDRLGVDHLFFKPDWNVLQKIFTASALYELYPKKALERASTICTSCMGIVKAFCLKTAVELGIPLIGYGWSPGQAPLQSSLMKNNPALLKMTQEAILAPLSRIAGDRIRAYFLREKHYADPAALPYNVHPLAWENYDEEMIVQEIKQYGWVSPADTDSNSTNCLLNVFANEVHIRRYGFHPYVWEIATLVRRGSMTRAGGLARIYGEPPREIIGRVQEKLGITTRRCGVS